MKDAKFYCDMIVDELNGDVEIGIGLAMAQARREAIEEAAKVCDANSIVTDGDSSGLAIVTSNAIVHLGERKLLSVRAHACGEKIRALIEKGKPSNG